jgi:hypothetical protein
MRIKLAAVVLGVVGAVSLLVVGHTTAAKADFDNYTYVANNITSSSEGDASVAAVCPAGYKVLGGGFSASTDAVNVYASDLGYVYVGEDFTGEWVVAFHATTSGQLMYVHAICAEEV